MMYGRISCECRKNELDLERETDYEIEEEIRPPVSQQEAQALLEEFGIA